MFVPAPWEAQMRAVRGESNKNSHPDVLETYAHEGVKMRHQRAYKVCPVVWESIGRTYKYLDVTSGVLFIAGSIGVLVIPLLRLYEVEIDWQLDISLIVSVDLFLMAKFLLESRAMYAAFFPSRHIPSDRWRYPFHARSYY